MDGNAQNISTRRRAACARVALAAFAAGVCCASLPCRGQWAGFAATGERAWTHAAADVQRSGSAAWMLPASLAVRWVSGVDGFGNAITFVPQQTAAVSTADVWGAGLVFAAGRVSPPGEPANQHFLFALDRDDGGVRWRGPVGAPAFDSNSSPAIDSRRGLVLFASGNTLRAWRLTTGEPAWERTLQRTVVNASPLVTVDRAGRDRVFITDYDGFGSAGRLYCINADVFDAQVNPYQPGEIVWSVVIGGASGNTPAYLPRDAGGMDRVYVASAGRFSLGVPGAVRAYAIDGAGVPVWERVNPQPHGFYGGVAVAPRETGDPGKPAAVYAASYAFYGGEDSANLVKMDARDGAVMWSVASNRTQSVPVALGAGRVALAGGINGFGTSPGLELFEDHGTHASLVWRLTGVDAPGGWTSQPLCTRDGGRDVLVVGAAPGASGGVSTRLFVVDLTLHPEEEGFARLLSDGAGSPAALVGGALYSIGPGGLMALGLLRTECDVSGDGAVTLDDLHAWEQGVGERDINSDGSADSEDRAAMIRVLRAGERALLTEGRR
ncbi:MAG: PQQ-like beta-propeller repeat protein [Phycisphaeraceae bacterium]|nr:PQQ-like beta-propeller repeat protein [Phycisphaeraceae bacterium]